MKAAVYDRNGGPEVLRYEEVPDPVCHPTGLVIRVGAISVEGGDTVNRWRGELPKVPHIVGYQAAGEVVEVGAEVDGFAVGDRVVTTGLHGSHAEYRAVHARTAWHIPEGMDLQLASTVPIPFGTADNCLFAYGHLREGDTALIQSGASAVGIAAIQLAKRAGVRVIATASSDARLAAVKEFGVDHGINYTVQDTVEEVMRITEGRGVDLALDGNGGKSLQASINSLGWKGRVTQIGFSARQANIVDVSSLMRGNRSVIGLALAMEMLTDRVRESVRRLIEEVAHGELRMPIDRTFPLAHAAEAHAYIESRQAVGRVLLIP